MFPPQMRILNKQTGKLRSAKEHAQKKLEPEPINRPHIFR
jgi:hypothetical protein